MNAYDFVVYARKNKFTVTQVKRQFPALPDVVCQGLLNGTAFIDHVNTDGSVVIDDGQP